ncbi:MAG: hypothetical protein UV34_C0051G0007 [Parcubacteria group bacterium GW2011_GWB1_42_6]|nr:MAG: hypothetical protein UV34_C0051G0007 [Parcubacteria group bacterium GW2011_GWB1_42_6]
MKKVLVLLACLAVMIFTVVWASAETKIKVGFSAWAENVRSVPVVGDTIWNRVNHKFILSTSFVVLEDSLGLLDGVSDKDAFNLLSGKIPEYVKITEREEILAGLFSFPIKKKVIMSRISVRYLYMADRLKKENLPPIEKEETSYLDSLLFVPIFLVFGLNIDALRGDSGKKAKEIRINRLLISYILFSAAPFLVVLLNISSQYFLIILSVFCLAGSLMGTVNSSSSFFRSGFLGFFVGSLILFALYTAGENILLISAQYSLLFLLVNTFSFYVLRCGFKWGGTDVYKYLSSPRPAVWPAE